MARLCVTEAAGAWYRPRAHIVPQAAGKLDTHAKRQLMQHALNLPLPGAEERDEARVRRRFSPGASAIVLEREGRGGAAGEGSCVKGGAVIV